MKEYRFDPKTGEMIIEELGEREMTDTGSTNITTDSTSKMENFGNSNVGSSVVVKNSRAKWILLLALTCIVVSILTAVITTNVVAGSGYIGSGKDNISIKTASTVDVTEAVAKKVGPAVVGITASMQVQGGFFGQTQEQSGVGTGMVVDKNGYILTNSHVVLDGQAEKLVVTMADGKELEGKLLWNDSTLDLAIVKVDAKNLPTVEMGNSDEVAIGSYVAAIGNPLGLEFNGSITSGVVSGLGRSITASDGTKQTKMDDLIQVDAAINSGNSGGPLLNKKGEVIGINTAKTQNAEGMGFAIPINTAKPIIEQIIKTGEYQRVYMGVSVVSVDVMKQNYPNLNIKENEGAYVQAVTENSPAQAAGLKAGDIIVKLEDKAVDSSASLIKSLLGYKTGDKVKLEILRDGTTKTVTVTLAGQNAVAG